MEVSNCLSFAKAASNLNLTPSTLSRNIKELEEFTGVLLFHRTTRKVYLTEAGEKYYEYCSNAFKEFEKGEYEISLLNNLPKGLLRVTMPTAFGKHKFVPLITDFLKHYPEIILELEITDQEINLIQDKIDIAIKLNNGNENELFSRKVMAYKSIAVATHNYLGSDTLYEPSELCDKNCLIQLNHNQENIWKMYKAEEEQTIKINGNLRGFSETGILEFVKNGLGIGLLPEYMIEKELKDNTLVNVLPNWYSQTSYVCITHSYAEHATAKVNRFIQFLIENLSVNK